MTAQTPLRKPWFRRYSAVELLGALILLFVVTPFIERLPNGQKIESILVTLVLISAVFAVAGHRHALLGATLAAPTIALQWLNHIHPEAFPKAWFYAGAILMMAFVIVHLLRFVLTAPLIDHQVLCASVAGYLMIGLLWSVAYSLTASIDSDAFAFSAPDQAMTSFNAFYLSFITLSTVGFGDITPISNEAKTLVIIEAVIGLFYITILIARLVALYSTSSNTATDR